MGTGGPYDSDDQANDDVLEYGTYIVPQSNALEIYPNAQISQAASNSKDADSPVDLGESAGLVFDAGTLYPLWSDNGNYSGSNPNGTRQQLNLYTADEPIGNFTPSQGAPIVSPFLSATGSNVLSLNGLATGSATTTTEKLVFADGGNIASGFTAHVLTFAVIFSDKGPTFNPSDTTSVLSLNQSGDVTAVSGRRIPSRQGTAKRWVERYTVYLNSPGVYTIESSGFSYNNNLDAFPSGILGEVVVSTFSGTGMSASR